MAMAIEIRVPALGESISEATVGKWFKKAGDAVRADEPLVELETNKVTLEVNAPGAGVLSEISAETGATVAIGTGLPLEMPSTVTLACSAVPASRLLRPLMETVRLFRVALATVPVTPLSKLTLSWAVLVSKP